MKLLMIANIIENNKTIGVRLLDCDAKKVQDVPIDNFKAVLSKPGNENMVANVKIVNGVLTGTNGKIDRYACLNRAGVPVTGRCPFVIINKIGEDGVGYTVSDFKGVMKKLRTEDVIKYGNELGIANGKICTQDGFEYVSSISGEYEVEKVTQSKLKGQPKGMVDVSIPMNMRDTSNLAKHARNDVENSINYNDVFLAMTPNQKSVLKQYYTWYTVKVYKSLAKNTRLNLAPGKAEKLAELRGVQNWKFGGVWDAGFMGASKCELGHSLRYEYYAIPDDSYEDDAQAKGFRDRGLSRRDYRKMVANEDFKIIFGETCAGDFFNIAPEDMKKLVKTREIMSNEIKLMADILSNKLEKEYMQKCELLYSYIKRLGSKAAVVGAFGNQVGLTLLNFIATGMPFPMSLVVEAANEIRKDPAKAFKLIMPDRRDAIDAIYGLKEVNYKLKYGKEFMDFVAKYTIEGDYAYDPFDPDKKRKDVGRYNKDTRYERTVELRNFRIYLKVRKITEESIDAYLKYVDTMIKFSNELDISTKGLAGYKTNNQLKQLVYEMIDKFNGVDRQALFVGYMVFDNRSEFRTFPNKIVTMDDRGAYTSNFNSIQECVEDLDNVFNGRDHKFMADKLVKLINQHTVDKEKLEKERQELINKEYDSRVPEESYYKIFTVGDENSKYVKADKKQGIAIERIRRKVEYEDCILESMNGERFLVSEVVTVMPISKEGYDFMLDALKNNEAASKAVSESADASEEPLEDTKGISNTEDKPSEDSKDADDKKDESEDKKDSDPMKELERLLSLVDAGTLKGDYGTEVCKDILNRGTKYNKLSYKQKWRVDNTIKSLQEQEKNPTEAVEVKDEVQSALDVIEVVSKAKRIIDKYNNDRSYKAELEKVDRLAIKIAYTVKSTGRCSEKQLKHLDKAVELISDEVK